MHAVDNMHAHTDCMHASASSADCMHAAVQWTLTHELQQQEIEQ